MGSAGDNSETKFYLLHWVQHGLVARDHRAEPTGDRMDIQIMVEPTLRETIQGIRVVIVSSLDDANVEDYDRGQQRLRLISPTINTGSTPTSPSQPIPVMTLQLVPDTYFSDWRVPPMKIVSTTLSPDQDPPLRVLWSTYLSQANLSESSPHTITLRCSHTFLLFPECGLTSGDLPFSHVFYILPTDHKTRLPPCFHRLPQKILHAIVHETCDKINVNPNQATANLKGILSITLVCKAWKSALRVYFERIGNTENDHRIANLGSLVDSLQCQPHMRKYIKSFRDLRIGHFGRRGSDVFKELVTLCTSLESLSINVATYHSIIEPLAQLTRVSDLTIPYSWGGGASSVEVYEVYDTVKLWDQLQSLSIGVGRETRHSRAPRQSPPALCAAFSLRNLSISQTPELPAIHFEDIYCLLQPVSTLTRFILTGLEELSQKDLREFLLYVSPTLETLEVRECKPPLKRNTDEELAIDAAIPHLRKIRSITASASFASVLTLSQKANDPVDRSQGNCGEMIWTLADIVGFDIEAINAALEITGWRDVSITLKQSFGMWRGELEDPMPIWQETAKRRGINLQVTMPRLDQRLGRSLRLTNRLLARRTQRSNV